MSEVGCRRSEDGRRKTEVRFPCVSESPRELGSEPSVGRSEVRRQRTEDRGQRTEVGSRRSEVGGRKTEGSPIFGVRNHDSALRGRLRLPARSPRTVGRRTQRSIRLGPRTLLIRDRRARVETRVLRRNRDSALHIDPKFKGAETRGQRSEVGDRMLDVGCPRAGFCDGVLCGSESPSEAGSELEMRQRVAVRSQVDAGRKREPTIFSSSQRRYAAESRGRVIVCAVADE